MKFGSVDNPEKINFELPKDHMDNDIVLKGQKKFSSLFLGSAKWNRQYLKGFYPKGIKDELAYYATKYNCIELNATFYNNYTPQQIEKWKDRVPDNFRFFPKVHQFISHIKRLKDTKFALDDFFQSVYSFDKKLEMSFIQMPENFSPKNFPQLIQFIKDWPLDLPLAFELRDQNWYNDPSISNELLALFREFQITTVITDTPGRRDLVHMALTTQKAFIRFVSSYHENDYKRIDDWIERLILWEKTGIESVYFFIHQDMEKQFPFLSTYLAKKMNQIFPMNLSIPRISWSQENQQINLF